MKIFSTVKISLISMLANKMRTALTVLGIVIGIASVIIVFSAGEGIKGLVFGQIESFGGTDTIETEIKVPTGKKGAAGDTQSATAMAQGVQITTLKIEDLDDINKIPNILTATPQ
jgi:putative ABC transport system permease protein